MLDFSLAAGLAPMLSSFSRMDFSVDTILRLAMMMVVVMTEGLLTVSSWFLLGMVLPEMRLGVVDTFECFGALWLERQRGNWS
jgi:hypothetical protein